MLEYENQKSGDYEELEKISDELYADMMRYERRLDAEEEVNEN